MLLYVQYIKNACSLHLKSKRMREESSGEEGGKRNEPFPNVSAANNTSWGKQDGLSNSGLDRLDHPSDVNNNSPPRYDKMADFK